MQVNRINTNINNIKFRENVLSREMDSQNAILMLRNQKATIKFQQNQEFAHTADSIETNPLKALGYKLYRTFSMIHENNQNVSVETKEFKAIA